MRGLVLASRERVEAPGAHTDDWTRHASSSEAATALRWSEFDPGTRARTVAMW